MIPALPILIGVAALVLIVRHYHLKAVREAQQLIRNQYAKALLEARGKSGRWPEASDDAMWIMFSQGLWEDAQIGIDRYKKGFGR